MRAFRAAILAMGWCTAAEPAVAGDLPRGWASISLGPSVRLEAGWLF